MARIEERRLSIDGQPARVFVGGDGPALLLVHGGWGGAALHWSRVWERLGERFRVIAPDLPGLGSLDAPALPSVAQYARWLVEVLDELGVQRAWCAGNSFGASVVFRLAAAFPERCQGLVLVDGIPMPRTPAPMLWLGRSWPGRALVCAALQRASYNEGALERAFADARHVPPGLRESLRLPAPPQLAPFARILIEGDGGPAPQAPILLLWGEADRLPGSHVADARKLHASLPEAQLALVPDAGHFPQLEQPERFVEALASFASAGTPDHARGPPSPAGAAPPG